MINLQSAKKNCPLLSLEQNPGDCLRPVMISETIPDVDEPSDDFSYISDL